MGVDLEGGPEGPDYMTSKVSYTSTVPPVSRWGQPLARSVAASRLSAATRV